jgi:hypothetical protein
MSRFEMDRFIMDWKPIDTAPFDRDVELAVIDGQGANTPSRFLADAGRKSSGSSAILAAMRRAHRA